MAGFWAESPVTREAASANPGSSFCYPRNDPSRPQQRGSEAVPGPHHHLPAFPHGTAAAASAGRAPTARLGPPGSLGNSKKRALAPAGSCRGAGKQLPHPWACTETAILFTLLAFPAVCSSCFPTSWYHPDCTLLGLKQSRHALPQLVLLRFTTCESVSKWSDAIHALLASLLNMEILQTCR